MQKKPRNAKANISEGIVALILGLIFIAVSISIGTSHEDPTVCGGETMQPGDTCTHIPVSGPVSSSDSRPIDYSYGQQIEYNTSQHSSSSILGAIAGTVLSAIGIGYIISGASKSSETTPKPSVSAPPSTSTNNRPQNTSTTAPETTPKPSVSAPPSTSTNNRPQNTSTTAQASLFPSFEILITQATQLRQQRKYQEALQEYEKAHLLKPLDPRVYAGRAVTLSELDREQEAMQDLEKAIKYAVMPKDKQILIGSHYLKALLLEREGHYGEALASLNSVFTLDLEYLPALQARARILTKQQQS